MSGTRCSTRKNKNNKVITPEYLDYDSNPEKGYDYFVGIDPSYSSTGLVVLNKTSNEPLEALTIKAGEPGEKFIIRMQKLVDKLEESVVSLDKSKTLVVMEGASFASEFNAFKLGKLSGVLEYYLGSHGYNYALISPTFAKKVATGKGAASKAQVIAGVRQRWGFTSLSADVNDAYTMAQIARGARPLK